MSKKTNAADALRQKNPRRGPRRIYEVCLIVKDWNPIPLAFGWIRARDSQEAIAMATRAAEGRGYQIDRVRNCIRLRPSERADVEREFADPRLRAAAFAEWEEFVSNPFLGFLGFEDGREASAAALAGIEETRVPEVTP